LLERAARKPAVYQGRIDLRQMDAYNWNFPTISSITFLTDCTFCSVPKRLETGSGFAGAKLCEILPPARCSLLSG